MAVDDHGLEVLKKAGEEVTPGSKADYYLKVSDVLGGPLKGIAWDDAERTVISPTVDYWAVRKDTVEIVRIEVTFDSAARENVDRVREIPVP